VEIVSFLIIHREGIIYCINTFLTSSVKDTSNNRKIWSGENYIFLHTHTLSQPC